MTFKERLKHDVQRVFVNPDIFGEVIVLCGKEVRAVVDDEGMVWSGDDSPALPQEKRVLYLASTDVPEGCCVGAGISLGSDVWTLELRREEMGLTVLKLTRPVAGDACLGW
jgi:hypothetical protein